MANTAGSENYGYAPPLRLTLPPQQCFIAAAVMKRCFSCSAFDTMKVGMQRFTKATVILNAPYLQNDMQVCRFTLADVLSVINEPEIPEGSSVSPYRCFRRNWGKQKIRVTYVVRPAMDGKEYALVTDVIADVPPDMQDKKHTS